MIALDALVCTAICLRVFFYRRQGAVHRPLAGVLAYVIVIAAGAVPLRAALCDLPEPSLSDIVLHAVLCLAVFAGRGNVVDLFKTSAAENCIHRIIRRTRHAQG
ncbi:MAG: phage holin family protein [Rhodocyclaceae bacterium]|nr:phage holin family protein [Rhodocyclaceae bacterium]